MLNDYLLLQIIILLTLLFLYWANDLFNTIILGIIYLLILSLYAFLHDSDIIISFLIILDLGIFLIFLVCILHFTRFLSIKYSSMGIYKNIYLYPLLTLFVGFFYYTTSHNSDFNFNTTIENIWFLYLSYYDYYLINNSYFSSEMHLLKEIYFNINYFEFFLMSVGIYFAVFNIYVLFYAINNIHLKTNVNIVSDLELKNRANSVFFFKNQNMIKQMCTTTGSRVWVKKFD